VQREKEKIMSNPATVDKTLTITMLSLAAGKFAPNDPAAAASVAAQRAAARAAITGKTPPTLASVLSPAKPVAPLPPAPAPALPAPKDGFMIMLAAGDASRTYVRKALTLCDGKVSTDKGATDLGAIPDSLATAIATLQGEVAALVTSLTASGQLTF
jgi:hypothetical protein